MVVVRSDEEGGVFIVRGEWVVVVREVLMEYWIASRGCAECIFEVCNFLFIE